MDRDQQSMALTSIDEDPQLNHRSESVRISASGGAPSDGEELACLMPPPSPTPRTSLQCGSSSPLFQAGSPFLQPRGRNSSLSLSITRRTSILMALQQFDQLQDGSQGDFGDYLEEFLDDESLPCLVVSRLEKIPLKDFSSEVRANLDIERFFKEATLLLDLEGANIECIVEKMLQSIFRADQESHSSRDEADSSNWLDAKVQEAKKTLFLQATWLDYTYQRLAKTIKSISVIDNEGLITDNSWLCTMCSLSGVHKRHVAIARLASPVNLGRSSEGVYFVLLVVTPTKEKGTKSDIELGRTFATILADSDFRQRLLLAETEAEFKEKLQGHAQDLGEEQKIYRRKSLRTKDFMSQAFSYDSTWPLCNGIRADLKRRLPHYPSDFMDGFLGNTTLRKLMSTVTFLYFACLMPSIAFGVLNDNQTGGKITVQRVILSQSVAGISFALFGGQPLIVMLTTAPLALYTRIIYDLSMEHKLDFFAFFGWVGLFNASLLLLYSMFDLSKLMRWSTRSTEEIFALFISVAFTKTPYLNRAKRELITDFSLPVSVLVMSFFGTYLFRDVYQENFTCDRQLHLIFVLARPLPWTAVLGAFGLAFPLSMLFFMDQNISSAMVNCPTNKLRKGSAYHWDLMVVAIINGCLSCFGLPWVHGALPHSPMHVKALADLEERIDIGQHVHQTVVRVRETRVTGIVSSLLIGLSLLMCPLPLQFIPVPVLDGLFICMAITALIGNQLFERTLLLFTEQAAYPPSHFLRRVPQRKVHIFTCLQLLQVLVLCALGFNSIAYAKLGFPVILLLQMPVRHLLIPKVINENYLDALDKAM